LPQQSFDLLQEHRQRGERFCELPNLAEDATRATTTATAITAPWGAKLGATKPAIKARCLVLIALLEGLIPFGAILMRFVEMMTPFGEVVTPVGLVLHPAPDVSLREILAGLCELLLRVCEVLLPLVGLPIRIGEVVPRLGELGGGSVIAYSVQHADSPLSRGACACLVPTLLGSLPAFVPARRNKFCEVCEVCHRDSPTHGRGSARTRPTTIRTDKPLAHSSARRSDSANHPATFSARGAPDHAATEREPGSLLKEYLLIRTLVISAKVAQIGETNLWDLGEAPIAASASDHCLTPPA
jgi:hypothetical protein